MLKNDFRYIIKRVIAAILIALILMFIKSHNVYAQEMSSTNVGAQSVTVTPGTAFADFTITGNPWANWRLGHLYFNFGITKTAGSSTDPIIVPRFVQVKSDTAVYICNFGTASYSNSTYTGASYSVDCPMDMGWPGLTAISIGFMPFTASANTTYNVSIGGWMTFEQNANTQVNVDTSGTTTAINNQITNDNTNTTNIINNQNQNTTDIIQSNQVCSMIDKSSVISNDSLLNTDGSVISSSSSFGVTDFISISSSDIITNIVPLTGYVGRLCFYNINKSFISCVGSSSYNNSTVSIPSTASFVRFSIRTNSNEPQFKLCRNGNQAISDGQQQINDTLNNSDVTGATSDAESFFSNFQSDSHGLSGIITAPLRLIQGLASSSCTALSIPLPFVNENATLPCMSTIYSTYFPTFLSLYQLITTGLIGYWVLIKIFGHVKGMQDPTDDRIEVLEL